MMASNYIPKNVKVVIQSENGILGMVCVGGCVGQFSGWCVWVDQFKSVGFSDYMSF